MRRSRCPTRQTFSLFGNISVKITMETSLASWWEARSSYDAFSRTWLADNKTVSVEFVLHNICCRRIGCCLCNSNMVHIAARLARVVSLLQPCPREWGHRQVFIGLTGSPDDENSEDEFWLSGQTEGMTSPDRVILAWPAAYPLTLIILHSVRIFL